MPSETDLDADPVRLHHDAVEDLRETVMELGREDAIASARLVTMLERMETMEDSVESIVDTDESADLPEPPEPPEPDDELRTSGGTTVTATAAETDTKTTIEDWIGDETPATRLADCPDVRLYKNGKPVLEVSKHTGDQGENVSFPTFMPTLRYIETFAKPANPATSGEIRDESKEPSDTVHSTLTSLYRAGLVNRDESSTPYRYWATKKGSQYRELYDKHEYDPEVDSDFE